uniref:Uncharacterized protein n=1 Tax=Aliivibrio fischeri TaxID=668 RepID=H2ERR1_ALIFS|nr:hypothetical protein [Aliivibrio fischeri]
MVERSVTVGLSPPQVAEIIEQPSVVVILKGSWLQRAFINN